MAQFFVDLNSEKSERLKLDATIRQLEVDLARLRRQIKEPSPSSLPAPFTVDPPSSAAFQDRSALDNIQISRPGLTISLRALHPNAGKLNYHELPHHPKQHLDPLRIRNPSQTPGRRNYQGQG